MPRMSAGTKYLRDEKIKSLLMKGYSTRKIAKLVGCSLSTINKVRKSFNGMGIGIDTDTDNDIAGPAIHSNDKMRKKIFIIIQYKESTVEILRKNKIKFAFIRVSRYIQ